MPTGSQAHQRAAARRNRHAELPSAQTAPDADDECARPGRRYDAPDADCEVGRLRGVEGDGALSGPCRGRALADRDWDVPAGRKRRYDPRPVRDLENERGSRTPGRRSR